MKYVIGITLFYGFFSFIFPGPLIASYIFSWAADGYAFVLFMGLIILCFIITSCTFFIYQEIQELKKYLKDIHNL